MSTRLACVHVADVHGQRFALVSETELPYTFPPTRPPDNPVPLPGLPGVSRDADDPRTAAPSSFVLITRLVCMQHSLVRVLPSAPKYTPRDETLLPLSTFNKKSDYKNLADGRPSNRCKRTV